MTEHSIEELERQYQSAKSKHEEAANNVNAAKKRLDAARLAATGLEGHMVSYTDRRKSEVFFIVREIGRFDEELRGPAIKKDGWPGERMIRWSERWNGALTDHGPYAEPTS